MESLLGYDLEADPRLPRRRPRPHAALLALRATLDVVPAAFALAGTAWAEARARLSGRKRARDALAAAALAAAAAAGAATLWLNAAIAAKVAQVVPRRPEPLPTGAGRAIDDAALAALPPPVARYLRYALPRGAPPLRYVRVTQRGEFRFRIAAGARDDDGWKKVSATLHAAALVPGAPPAPGYVWAAAITLAPGLTVRGWDAYTGGRGHMLWRLAAGLLPLASSSAPEVDQSALLRYLSDAVYFPSALLPSRLLRWEPVSDHAARAVLSGGPGAPTVAGVFHFGPGGQVLCMKTTDRARPLEDGSVVSDAHTTEYGGWARTRTGVRVPTRAEMTWDLLRPFTYGRLEVADYAVWDAAGEGWR